MGKKAPGHRMTGLWVARVNCACGWYWHNEEVRHKSDDDLILKAREEFDIHVNDMRKEGQ